MLNKINIYKKIKGQRGMSHIMVLLSIIIIIAAICAGIYYAKEKYEEEKIETLKTNMVTLQAKIKIISDEISIKKEGITYIGKKLSENLEDSDVKKIIQKNIISEEDENFSEYYILENEDFVALKLLKYPINKIIVNYKTYEIINIDGFKLKEELYYKLSDFNNISD